MHSLKGPPVQGVETKKKTCSMEDVSETTAQTPAVRDGKVRPEGGNSGGDGRATAGTSGKSSARTKFVRKRTCFRPHFQGNEARWVDQKKDEDPGEMKLKKKS